METIQKIIATLNHYVNLRLELLKLNMQKALLQVIASLMVWVLILVPLSFFLFFVSLFIGLVLGDLMDCLPCGFGIVTLVYLLMTIVAYAYRIRLRITFHEMLDSLAQQYQNKDEATQSLPNNRTTDPGPENRDPRH